MKIQRDFSTRGATHLFEVTLENDAERALDASELALICDNRRGVTFDPVTRSYSLNGESFGPRMHFGGGIERRNGDVVTVFVYVD